MLDRYAPVAELVLQRQTCSSEKCVLDRREREKNEQVQPIMGLAMACDTLGRHFRLLLRDSAEGILIASQCLQL